MDYKNGKKYGGKHFNKIVAQNDIMVFVGNGFDIKILKKLNKKILPLYQKFFDFLEYAECNKENKLFLKMKQDKGNTENWCDFENALYELIPTGKLLSTKHKSIFIFHVLIQHCYY